MGFNDNENKKIRRSKRSRKKRKNSSFFPYFLISLILVGVAFLSLTGLETEKKVAKSYSKAAIHRIEEKFDGKKYIDFDRDKGSSPIEDKSYLDRYKANYSVSEEPIKEKRSVFSNDKINKIEEKIGEIRELIKELEKLSTAESEIKDKIEQKFNILEKTLEQIKE